MAMEAPAGDVRLSRIGQIAIAVHDVARATAFYRDVLGLRLLFEAPPGLAFFDCEGVRLMLSLPEGEGQDHAGSVLYFAVPDIGEAYRQLTERGARFVDAPHKVADMGTYELWMAFFHDGEVTTHAVMSEVRK